MWSQKTRWANGIKTSIYIQSFFVWRCPERRRERNLQKIKTKWNEVWKNVSSKIFSLFIEESVESLPQCSTFHHFREKSKCTIHHRGRLNNWCDSKMVAFHSLLLIFILFMCFHWKSRPPKILHHFSSTNQSTSFGPRCIFSWLFFHFCFFQVKFFPFFQFFGSSYSSQSKAFMCSFRNCPFRI